MVEQTNKRDENLEKMYSRLKKYLNCIFEGIIKYPGFIIYGNILFFSCIDIITQIYLILTIPFVLLAVSSIYKHSFIWFHCIYHIFHSISTSQKQNTIQRTYQKYTKTLRCEVWCLSCKSYQLFQNN